jgi:hypothetical protein
MGITTPGKSTVFRKGKMGITSGYLVFLSCSLSPSDIGIMGIKSTSSSDLKNISFINIESYYLVKMSALGSHTGKILSRY